MQLPGTPSLVFLLYLLGFLPWIALRGARRMRVAGAGGKLIASRQAIWTSTLIMMIALLALTWITGRSFGYEFFAKTPLNAKNLLATLAALAACFGLRWIAQVIRSEEERRRMPIYRWAPRLPREWLLWTLMVLVGSVAEEAAYRGVGMSILWYALGNPWLAALISSIAFAVAHATQGWKSAAVVFGVALVMHGLVAFTGGLLPAIVVHAVYDLIAGYAISVRARRYDEENVLHSPLPANAGRGE
jgi:membrane protease YdiL (CAAX protease family)